MDEFKNILADRRASGSDVAAIIVEPITHFNNKSATPYFYKQLRKITKEHGVTMIVDETRTGVGSSGKMWAHDYWYLQDSPADIVTFGGKAGVSGFYSNLEHRTNTPCASFEQNVDMTQVLNFGVTWKAIQYEKLLELQHDTNTFLKIELGNVARDKKWIHNIRGNGSFVGFDVENELVAEKMERWFARGGIQLLRCGPRTFGIRSALIFGPKHAASLRESLKYFSMHFEETD